MKGKIFLICFACAAFLLVSTSCKSPNSPEDNNPPEPTKFYTIRIWYIPTEILQPDQAGGPIYVTVLRASEKALNYAADVECQGQDNYNFYGECQLESNTTDTWYDIWAFDFARYDGSDCSSRVVGDRFILTVKETGFQKELEDVVPNRTIYNPAHGDKSTMARFRITYEGRIIDYQ